MSSPVAALGARAAGGFWLLAILGMTAAAPLWAQDPDEPLLPGEAGEPMEHKQAVAVWIRVQPPEIDGRLDDPAWMPARFVSGFQATRDPEQTEIAFLYDQENLYIGARMRTARPRDVFAAVGRRDEPGISESIVISLDTYRDRRTAYTFEVTAGGVRHDYYHPEDRFGSRDYGWNPVWEARTARDSTGWTAEIRIPFSQLRFLDADQQRWGVNFVRRIPARSKNSYWIRVSRDNPGWASQFGELVGIQGVHPQATVVVLPYVAAESVFQDQDGENPLDESERISGRGGGDLTAAFPFGSLDLTINPDFSQVPADPALVNLSAFEVRVPELRPFFLGASAALSGGGPRWFYSRRIGVAPRGPAAGDFVDRPDHTTVLGAGRLTARSDEGLSLSALTAVSSREEARTFDVQSGTFNEVEVEPTTVFGVARLERASGTPASVVGGTFTVVSRSISRDDPLESQLVRQALAGGLDAVVRIEGTGVELSGHVGGSHVSGDDAAILRLQHSSARYFQRPDAEHVEIDDELRSLTGWTAGANAAKVEGSWLWDAGFEARSPGFEINDAGILGIADRMVLGGGTGVILRPGGPFRYMDVRVRSDAAWNWDGDRVETAPSVSLTSRWRNLWTTYASLAYDVRSLSDKLARGGPLVATPRTWRGSFGVSGDPGATLQWSLDGTLWRDDLSGDGISVSAAISFQAGPRWRFSIVPGYDQVVDPLLFFAALRDGPDETFGTRYVFSTVDHRSVYAQLRTDVALTPDLSLDFYAEPFASSGTFSDFGELVRPRDNELLIYGTGGTSIEFDEDEDEWRVVTPDGDFTLDDRDFEILSFRANAVVRWEWRRGSTLYLIWQHDRFANQEEVRGIEPGSFASSLANSVFQGAGANTIALKLNYWLPID